MPCPNFNPSRCSECPGDTNVVPPDMGTHSDGDILFVGEAPGADENDKLRPFIGKAGKEFNEHYLRRGGLTRELITITNAVKCRPRNNKTPDPKLVKACSKWHLKQEIKDWKPRLVVLMGATACSLVPGIDLTIHHGIPREAELWGHKCTVFPMYHPAAGLHDTVMMIPLRQDFEALYRVRTGELRVKRDLHPEPLYQEITYTGQLDETLKGTEALDMAMDTETLPGRRPYSIQYSVRPGTGYVIRQRALWSDFAYRLKRRSGRFAFHNGLYDIPVVREMGIVLPWDRVVDTMIVAYHTGRFPKGLGLKSLAYRLCGMEMQEFEDLVRPYHQLQALEYMHELAEVTWEKPEDWGKRQWSLNQYLNRALGDAAKADDEEKLDQIIARWEDWPTPIVLPAIQRFGDIPEPTVALVPDKEFIRYSCRDADATLRVLPELEAIVKEINGRVAA
jgi:uracil-DNA glycosylase family 4